MVLYNYIIFHKGCIDGFSSFIILAKSGKISHDGIIYLDVPSAKKIPPNIENKTIIIMDVAYKKSILEEIVDLSTSVTFIDHHITIRDDVNSLSNNEKLTVIYDENESGASLTWKFFNPNMQLPLFIRYIKDNDIGKWKLKYTHEFIASLDVHYNLSIDAKNISRWNKLFKPDVVKKIIKKGKIYKEYMDFLLGINSKKYSMEAFPSEKIYEEYSHAFRKPGEYKVAVVCGSGCPSISLLGLKIAQTIDCDFVIIWNLHLDKKEYVLSFRSQCTDVGTIAKIFGGGGHTLASACSFPITKYSIQDLFFPQSLPRQNK